MRQRSVAIVHKFIPDYRVPFYSELLSRCAAADIDLSIIHGDGDGADRTKGYLRYPPFRPPDPQQALAAGQRSADLAGGIRGRARQGPRHRAAAQQVSDQLPVSGAPGGPAAEVRFLGAG